MKDKLENVITLAVVAIAIILGYSNRTASANSPQPQTQRFVPSGEDGLALDTKTGQLCNSMVTPDTFPLCSYLAKQ